MHTSLKTKCFLRRKKHTCNYYVHFQHICLLLATGGQKDYLLVCRLKCCFTSTETIGLFGTGAQDVHLDFHTAPELWLFVILFLAKGCLLKIYAVVCRVIKSVKHNTMLCLAIKGFPNRVSVTYRSFFLHAEKFSSQIWFRFCKAFSFYSFRIRKK